MAIASNTKLQSRSSEEIRFLINIKTSRKNPGSALIDDIQLVNDDG
jgi:hypothetical protein